MILLCILYIHKETVIPLNIYLQPRVFLSSFSNNLLSLILVVGFKFIFHGKIHWQNPPWCFFTINCLYGINLVFIHQCSMWQIYCRGLLLKTIYGRGSLLKQIARRVSSVRGCRHWHWREAWIASDNGGIGGRGYRHWCWRDRLSRREEGYRHWCWRDVPTWTVPPLAPAGHWSR